MDVIQENVMANRKWYQLDPKAIGPFLALPAGAGLMAVGYSEAGLPVLMTGLGAFGISYATPNQASRVEFEGEPPE